MLPTRVKWGFPRYLIISVYIGRRRCIVGAWDTRGDWGGGVELEWKMGDKAVYWSVRDLIDKW